MSLITINDNIKLMAASAMADVCKQTDKRKRY